MEHDLVVAGRNKHGSHDAVRSIDARRRAVNRRLPTGVEGVRQQDHARLGALDAGAHQALDLENHFVFVNLCRGRWLAPGPGVVRMCS